MRPLPRSRVSTLQATVPFERFVIKKVLERAVPEKFLRGVIWVMGTVQIKSQKGDSLLNLQNKFVYLFVMYVFLALTSTVWRQFQRMAKPGLEPGTPAFSVQCSTN